VVRRRTLSRSSLSEGYGLIRRRFIDGWEAWEQKLIIPECPPDIEREAYISSVVLKVHEDGTFPGSIVASLSVPWGQSSDSSGGYHLVWARDCVEAGLALVAVGQVDDARWMLSYLIATQANDGRWNQSSFPDGRPYWTGIQLDEVGFPIVLASKLMEEDAATQAPARAAGLGGRVSPPQASKERPIALAARPALRCPVGRDVLVDVPAPFALHVGFDGWQATEDRPSTPLAFGRHGVRLAAKDFDGHRVADFTLYLVDTGQWEGRDHHVRLTQPGA